METFIIIIIIFLIILYFQYRKINNLQNLHDETSQTFEANIEEASEKYSKLLSQKKSSEVRLGQITEHIVPFLDAFPYNPKRAQFMGNPIDFVVFDTKEIAFIEVKTGNSRLNKNQQNIKKLIDDKKVVFKTIRIK